MNPEGLESQKLELLGQMTAAILHDIKSPLTYINSNNRHLIKKIKKISTDDSTTDALLEILAENETGLNHIKEILNNISRFVKHDKQLKVCLLHQIVEDSKQIVLPQTHGKINIELKLYHEDLVIEAISSQVIQVLINLMVNSIEAFSQGHPNPQIRVETQKVNREIILIVADNALGIAPEKLATVFDWYVTSKENGTGQGLAISKQIIENHLGTIECQSTLNEGTNFIIRLPEASS